MQREEGSAPHAGAGEERKREWVHSRLLVEGEDAGEPVGERRRRATVDLREASRARQHAPDLLLVRGRKGGQPFDGTGGPDVTRAALALLLEQLLPEAAA